MNELSNYSANRVQGGQLSQTRQAAKGDETINRFLTAMQITEALQHATLIPDHLRGTRKKVGSSWEMVPFTQEQIRANVLMVVNRALQWEVDPIALLSESYVVGGKLDFQGKVIIAVVNRLGRIKGNLRFEFEGSGDSLAVTVIGELLSEPGNERVCELTYLQAVTRDGYGKINEQWTKDPQQKLIYSGAKKWARQHTPEVVLGLFGESEELPEAVVMYAEKKPISRAANDTSIDDEYSIFDDYSKRISGAKKESLSGIVDSIKVAFVLTDDDKQELIGRAKDRWKLLTPAEPKAVEVVPETETEASMSHLLTYEAAIHESQSSEGLQALAETIAADESLSITQRKGFAGMVNERGRKGFGT